MATIATYDFQDKRALVRVDFNVPLNKETLEVTDDTQKDALRLQLKQLEDDIYEPIKGLLESYQMGITQKEAMLPVKDYYFKKKYLDRIADQLR